MQNIKGYWFIDIKKLSEVYNQNNKMKFTIKIMNDWKVYGSFKSLKYKNNN